MQTPQRAGPPADPSAGARLLGALRRVHAALMPDYNRKAAVYWWTVVLLGAAVLVHSIGVVAHRPAVGWVQLAICASLSLAAGMMPVRIPRSTNSFTAGEIFIFLLLLLQGPEAATIASAGEALLGAWRTSKRWTSRIASPAMASLSMFSSGMAMTAGVASAHARGFTSDAVLLLGAIALAICYFFVNTLLVTMVPRLKRNEPLNVTVFMESFGWLGLVYAGNASVAAFLFLGVGHSGLVAVVAAIPVIGVFLSAGHYFFRREEAKEAVRIANEAKAEQAARHVMELKASEQRFHDAFTHAAIGMALVTFEGTIRQSNPAFCALLGLPEEATLGMSLGSRMTAESALALQHEFDRIRAGGQANGLELRVGSLDGRDVWLMVHCSQFTDLQAEDRCVILQAQDVTSRRQAEADLHHIAFHDALTNLPNRQRFNEHLTQAIELSHRVPGAGFGVLFLDFDRFKLINDSLGHPIGDEYLVQVSRRIERALRPGDVVARLGGDEFAILITRDAVEATLVTLARRLLEVLAEPLSLGGVEITGSASIGITLSTSGYRTPEEVLRDADTAMYRAKAQGKARFALFDMSLHTEVANRLRLEGDLRHALANEELAIQYQPLFNLGSGALMGFEALARWNHPTLGQISPASFIPIAEESGAIVQLTDFVLRRACSQLRHWQQGNPAFANLTIHVNVAGNDIAKKNLVERVTKAVDTAGLRPKDLTIELTENILMGQLTDALEMLNRLSTMGVGLSVDDFGTGYSSLSHLSSLPISSLKIDRSFVSNLVPESKEAAIIRAIVLLGHSLGKSVVAEGVETLAQLEQLEALGCDVGQGYFLGRPMWEDAVGRFLDARISKPIHAAAS